MSFRTYVINLDSQPIRWKEQYEQLRKVGIYPIRVPGVLGKDVPESELEKHFEQTKIHFMPMSMIGCAYSHILVAKKLLQTSDEIALVLEDDAYPLFKNVSELSEYITTLPPSAEWDYVSLHCDRNCVNNGTLTSAAAQFISRRGAINLLNMKINTHIDKQTSREFKKLFSKNFFRTNEDSTEQSFNRNNYSINKYIPKPKNSDKTWLEHMSYKLFRIPFFNIEINKLEYILLYIIIICIVIATLIK